MWEGTGVAGSRNRGARSQRRKNTWRLWKVGRGEGEVRTRPFELRVGPRPLTRWLVCAAAERAAEWSGAPAARGVAGSCTKGKDRWLGVFSTWSRNEQMGQRVPLI